MIIKYRGQLYKRVDAGEKKIAEVLKRKLQTEASKVGAKIDITGSVNEKTGGESRQVGKIIIEPQEEGLDRHKQQGLPRYSEQAKDENAVKAASYILRSLELPSDLPAYASQLGRLDASLAKEVKALYAKASEIASRCKELYQKHR